LRKQNNKNIGLKRAIVAYTGYKLINKTDYIKEFFKHLKNKY